MIAQAAVLAQYGGDLDPEVQAFAIAVNVRRNSEVMCFAGAGGDSWRSSVGRAWPGETCSVLC